MESLEHHREEPKRKKANMLKYLALGGMLTFSTLTKGAPSGPENEQLKAHTETVDTTSRESIFSITDLVEYFPVDEATISPERKQELAEQFRSFLKQITEENLSYILSSVVVIYGSSDDRETSRPGGNTQLTADRIDAVRNILEEVCDEMTFRNPEIGEKLKQELQFEEVMPTSAHGPERGVLYLEDLTDKDVATLSAEEIDTLRREARSVYVSIQVPVEKLPERMPAEEAYEHLFASLSKLDGQAVIALDNSRSMQNPRKLFMQKVTNKLQTDTLPDNLAVSFFTESTTPPATITSVNQLQRVLQEYPIDNQSLHEYAVTAALQSMEQFSQSDRIENLVVVLSDERIQDLSYESLLKLKETAREKGSDVQFWLLEEKTGTVHMLSLSQLEVLFMQYFNEHYATKISNMRFVQADAIAQGKGRFARHYQEEIDRMKAAPIPIGFTNGGIDVLVSR